MSLFSALYTGASGMLAQSRATQSLSNNIANATTVGYKRYDSGFSDLVSQSSSRATSATSTLGGVFATEILRASEQGAIQSTSSKTDLAVAGNGFFVVNDSTDGSGEFLYTRAGQFDVDSTGILKNTAGYALYGHLTDVNGVAQGDDLNSLVPVDLSLFPQQHFETTAVSAAINLEASETPINPHTLDTATQLPVSGVSSANYSRTVTVYDQNGDDQNLRMEFRHITGPMAHFSSRSLSSTDRDTVLVDDINGPTQDITAGNIFQISDGTDVLDITFVDGDADLTANQANTLGDVLDVINAYTGAGTTPLFTAAITASGRLEVKANDPTVTLDITGSDAVVLGSDGFSFIQDPDAIADYTYEPDADVANLAATYPGQGDFPAITDPTNANSEGWWEVSIVHVDPETGVETAVSEGLMNFDGDGRLSTASNAGVDGVDSISLAAGNLPFVTTGGIDIDVTRFTQFSGVYETLELTQDGAPETAYKDVIISDDGLVSLRFASNLTRAVYRLPLATFNNPDGLQSINGTAFRVSADSGEPLLNEPTSGAAGTVNAYALESSNVDIAKEFGNMIVTQRAYSMNAQIVQAANEMTQTTAQLKR